MIEIYDRLEKLGYSREFLQRVMPDWWTEETDADPECVISGAAYLARWLGLSLWALIDPQSAGRLLRENPWAQLPNEDDRDLC